MLKQQLVEQYLSLEENLSKENILKTLEKVANTLAPSQSIMKTRSPVIEQLINNYELDNVVFTSNYLGTGNAMFSSKKESPSILFIAHLDQISYLVDEQTAKNVWRLIPYCKHLSQIDVRGKALRYDLNKNRFRESAAGTIFSEKIGNTMIPFFRTLEGQLESGDRIVYEFPINVEGDLVSGNIDNAAGVTACLVAGSALFKAYPQSNVGFIFSDEEEGPSDNPIYFARGVRRLMNKMETPDVCIIIDGHGGREGEDIGEGTFFTEKTAGGEATVTPPELFVKIKSIGKELHPFGINLFEDTGRVSRSDDIPCLAVTPNVISIGYPSVNRHHDQGPPTASLKDLANLAKVIFWLGIMLDRNYE
ncbi:MAG TPA: hypothetical protein DDX29_11960 [Clostridiales bacterium]|nr:hypothetical protein [Clostridiales bacterium]